MRFACDCGGVRNRFVLTGLMCMALLLVGIPAIAEDSEYSLEVSRIFLQGKEVSATDAAEYVMDGKTVEVKTGNRLPTGAMLKVYYPQVQIHVVGPDNSHIVLECAKCTPEKPLELTVGNPAGNVPFRQKHGNVTYEVKTKEEKWFEIFLKVLRGPDEVIVPVAVRGTRFILEPDRTGAVVTVGRGLVEVGRDGVNPGFEVGKGLSLAGPPGAFKLGKAQPALLQYMDNVIGPTPAMHLSPRTGLPVSGPFVPPPGAVPTSPSWPQWLLVGGGAAAAGAGGIVHFLASRAEADASADARQRCAAAAPEVGKATAHAQADAWYEQQYKDKVRPLEASAFALYGAGAAMVAGGIIWRLVKVGSTAARPVSWHLMPLPSNGFAAGAGWEF